jgi:8-oxo-dGTP pyrophosphatase MutT (NUDIX family)
VQGPTDEVVEVLDDEWRVLRVEPRSVVRAGNLLHRTVAVLVRNPAGDVYVHRRSPDKAIYAGLLDVWAGGALGAGEDPLDGARRELAEELGIDGVELVPLFECRVDGPQSREVVSVFEVTWDGPVTFRDGEVVSGEWLPLDAVGPLRDEMVPGSADLLDRRLGLHR